MAGEFVRPDYPWGRTGPQALRQPVWSRVPWIESAPTTNAEFIFPSYPKSGPQTRKQNFGPSGQPSFSGAFAFNNGPTTLRRNNNSRLIWNDLAPVTDSNFIMPTYPPARYTGPPVLFASQYRPFVFRQSTNDYSMVAGAASYALSGQATGTNYGRVVSAASGAYALTGQAANVLVARVLPGTQGAYALSGQTASFNRTDVNFIMPTYARQARTSGPTAMRAAQRRPFIFNQGSVAYLLPAAQGSYAVTGQAASVLVGRQMAITAGAYALSGQGIAWNRTDVNFVLPTYARVARMVGPQAVRAAQRRPFNFYQFLSAYVMPTSAGSYALNGQSANELVGHVVSAASGAYALTGQASGLLRGLRTAPTVGTYALNGQTASLLRALKIVAAQGAYSLNGQSAALKRALLASVTAGTYSLTGQSAALLIARRLLAITGSYDQIGEDDLLAVAEDLFAEGGAYGIIGSAVDLTKTDIEPVISIPGQVVAQGQSNLGGGFSVSMPRKSSKNRKKKRVHDEHLAHVIAHLEDLF